jgi:hypothetical protein
MCVNKLKLFLPSVRKLMYMEPRKKLEYWKIWYILLWNLSCNTQLPVTHWLISRSEWSRSRGYHEISAFTLATTGVFHIRALSHNRFYTIREIRSINHGHGMDIVVLGEGNRNSRNIRDFFNATLLHINTIIYINKVTSFCDIMIYYHELPKESFQRKTFLESLWFDTDGDFFVLLIPSKKVIFFLICG